MAGIVTAPPVPLYLYNVQLAPFMVNVKSPSIKANAGSVHTAYKSVNKIVLILMIN
jgi:hypothetical protein